MHPDAPQIIDNTEPSSGLHCPLWGAMASGKSHDLGSAVPVSPGLSLKVTTWKRNVFYLLWDCYTRGTKNPELRVIAAAIAKADSWNRCALKMRGMSRRMASDILYLALKWFMNIFYFYYHNRRYAEAEILFNLSLYGLPERHCNLARPLPSQDLSLCCFLHQKCKTRTYSLSWFLQLKMSYGQPCPLRHKWSMLGEILILVMKEMCIWDISSH